MADVAVPLNHSFSPTTAYVRPNEEFLKDNYDPYRKPILAEPDPHDARRTGSTLRTIIHLLFGV